MANNKLVIDLGDVKLTDKQLKSLHKAIHKVVSQKVKKVKIKPSTARDFTITADNNDEGKTATLEVTFNNVDAGLSNLTAKHKGTEETIHESGTISFNNVKANDTIVIKGDSAGSKTVTVSGVNAMPTQMNFAEGQHINGIFLIGA